MIEKRIYNGYAFSENEDEKSRMNFEIWKELENKYKIGHTNNYDWIMNSNNHSIEDFDLFYVRTPKYRHGLYEIKKNNTKLTTEELLLIFDRGNLCFGGTKLSEKAYRVSED